jgi:hypothetical protein
MSVSLVRLGGLLTLPQELPIHGDEQLLTVLPEAHIAADSLNYVQAGLGVPACDRQVAKQPRQGARLQFQSALQVWDLSRDRQRAAVLPLGHRRLADARDGAKRTQRQPSPGASLLEDPAELVLLRCSSQTCCSLVRAVAARSIAQWPAGRVLLLVASYSSLDDLSLVLYDLSVVPQHPKPRHG